MDRKKESFILYCDARKHIAMLDDAQAGRLFRLLLDYAADGADPGPEGIGDGMVAMAFSFLSAQIGRDQEKYSRVREKRREAGRVGGRLSAAKRAGGKQIQANACSVKQAQAHQAEHDPEPYPVPEPEPYPEPYPDPYPDPLPEPAPGDEDAPPPEGWTPPALPDWLLPGGEGDGTRTTTTEKDSAKRTERTDRTMTTGTAGKEDGGAGSPLPQRPDSGAEGLWVRLGLGEGALPALGEMLAASRAKGLEEPVLEAVVRRTAEHQPKAPLAYLRSSLEQCEAGGIRTMEQFRAAHSGSGRGLRVDRAAPSGNNILAHALERPLRKKLEQQRQDAPPEPVYALLT